MWPYPGKPNEHTSLQTRLSNPSRNGRQLRVTATTLRLRNILPQLPNRSLLVERHQRRRRNDIPDRSIRRRALPRHQARQTRKVNGTLRRRSGRRMRPARAGVFQVSPNSLQASCAGIRVAHPRPYRKATNPSYVLSGTGAIDFPVLPALQEAEPISPVSN